MPWNKSGEYYIDFEEDVYATFSNVNLEFDTDIFRFSYTSLTTPNSIFDYYMKSYSPYDNVVAKDYPAILLRISRLNMHLFLIRLELKNSIVDSLKKLFSTFLSIYTSSDGVLYVMVK